jgi:glycosyltransferase involved in cell wall biosynthesis
LKTHHAQDVFFSIVIPTRNRIEQLSFLLSELEKQTFRNFEVLIVDDSSLQQVRDQYPQFVNNYSFETRLLLTGQAGEPGRGAAFSRNWGAQNARGKYIGFIDDDDYWHDYLHLELAARILNDAKYNLYIANQRGISPDGEIIIPSWMYEIVPYLSSWQPLEKNVYHASKQAFLANMDFFPHVNVMIVSKGFYQSLGGMRDDVTHYEDMEFAIRAIDHSNSIVFTDNIVSTHNIPDRSINMSLSSMLDEKERHVKILNASNFLEINCITNEGKKYGKSRAGGALKGLSLFNSSQGEYRNALRFALRALVSQPTVKWLVYSCYLSLRAIFSSK